MKGHFSQVCEKQLTGLSDAPKAQVASIATGLAKTMIKVRIDCYVLNALVDTGSSDSFINQNIVRQLNLPSVPSSKTINLASSAITLTDGIVTVPRLEVDGNVYKDFPLSVLPGLCCDVLLGHDLLSKHKRLIVRFNGEREDIQVNTCTEDIFCNLVAANIDHPVLFHNLTDDCHPIVCKSRKYSDPDREFISAEISRLLEAGIIVPSQSPWRAQVLVHRDDNHHPRLVVDYSRTINKFTHLYDTV